MIRPDSVLKYTRVTWDCVAPRAVTVPSIQAFSSPLSMSRYLGLSGNHGRVRSWMKPGMALLARRYCQHDSPPKTSLEINNPVSFFLFANPTAGLACRAYLSPTTWPSTTPNAVKTAEDREAAPLKRFGALSPKYMGCTFMLIPSTQQGELKTNRSFSAMILKDPENADITHLHLCQSERERGWSSQRTWRLY